MKTTKGKSKLDNSNNDMQLVFELVKTIPFGKVSTYGAIANALGLHARIVGYYLNLSHQYKNIPAHRVVNRNGMLTGKMHFATIDTMQQLLEAEGVAVKDDSVLDFDQKFWNPLHHNY